MGGETTCFNGAINQDGIECLNEDQNHPAANLFRGGDDCFLQNDTSVDQQLLIKVPLRQPVKLNGLRIVGKDADTAPKEVKVFVNKPHIGFQEAEDEEPTQAFELDPKECNIGLGCDSQHIIPLKFVKFQNVTHITVFVAENNGDNEATKMRALELYGIAAENMDMAAWKPCKS